MMRAQAEACARRVSGLMDEGVSEQKSLSSIRLVSPRFRRDRLKASASDALMSLGHLH